MEQKIKVNTFMLNYECDKCKEGQMIFQRKAKKGIDNKSMLYMHRCSKCSVIQDIKNKQYPAMRYEKVLLDRTHKRLDLTLVSETSSTVLCWCRLLSSIPTEPNAGQNQKNA